ncbi:MAG: hypothetical protein AAGC57_06465 [Pseudomonadota bacterium]
MNAIDLHPAELAYALAYAKADGVIGWEEAVFLPPAESSADPADWFAEGEARLLAAGRLVGASEQGLSITDDMAAALLALANPGLVLLAQRRSAEGVHTLTIHGAGRDLVGLRQRPDGLFEMTRYAELTAAVGACAGFVGAAQAPAAPASRLEASHAALAEIAERSATDPAEAAAALVALGAAAPAARSAARAFAEPSAAGVVSVLYCAGNEVEDVESVTVLTTDEGESWSIVAPAGSEGPTILERSSVTALTARIAVDIAARLGAG